jgi:hypothetical protein
MTSRLLNFLTKWEENSLLPSPANNQKLIEILSSRIRRRLLYSVGYPNKRRRTRKIGKRKR